MPTKPTYDPQSQPMAIGSAFDAYMKAHCIRELRGVDMFTELFEMSVEKQNRDWALKEGKYLFDLASSDKYGVTQGLMHNLKLSPTEPRFEFELRGTLRDVPFLGKPDVFYSTPDALPVILDFKVNGYCAKTQTSCMAGYMMRRPDGKIHKDVVYGHYGVTPFNKMAPLDEMNDDWAGQLSVYAWLCGVEPGNDFLCKIMQVCGNPKLFTPKGMQREVEMADHTSMVSSDFQIKYLEIAVDIWDRVTNGHFFRDLPLADSNAKCDMIDRNATLDPAQMLLDR